MNITEAQQFYRTKTVVAPAFVGVYSNDFEATIGPEWSVSNAELTPSGGRRFLGRFTNNLVRLNLAGLTPHKKLRIGFELYVIQSWNGNSSTNGPDFWSASVTGGPTLLTTTFHGSTSDISLRQAYPGMFPGSSFAARTGAVEVDTLGYNPDGDAVYRLSYTFPHTNSSIEISFSGGTTEAVANESWGLDNVVVALSDDPY